MDEIFGVFHKERDRVAFLLSDEGKMKPLKDNYIETFASPFGTKNQQTKKEHQKYWDDLRMRKVELDKKLLIVNKQIKHEIEQEPERGPKSFIL